MDSSEEEITSVDSVLTSLVAQLTTANKINSYTSRAAELVSGRWVLLKTSISDTQSTLSSLIDMWQQVCDECERVREVVEAADVTLSDMRTRELSALTLEGLQDLMDRCRRVSFTCPL